MKTSKCFLSKVFCLIICISMAFSIVSCGKKTDEEAIALAQEIYEKLNDIDMRICLIDLDFCKAGDAAINNSSKLSSQIYLYLYTQVSLTEKETTDAWILTDWDNLDLTMNLNDDNREMYYNAVHDTGRLSSGRISDFSTDDWFDFCEKVILNAYIRKGTIKEIERDLSDVKNKLKELKNDHSNYENYDILSDYYLIVANHFDYCQTHKTSMLDLTSNVNQYVTDVEKIKNKLELIF